MNMEAQTPRCKVPCLCFLQLSLHKNRKGIISCTKNSLLRRINTKCLKEKKLISKRYKTLKPCSNLLWLNLYLYIKSRSRTLYTENLLLKSNQLLKNWAIAASTTWRLFRMQTCIHSFYTRSNWQQRYPRPQPRATIVMTSMREYRLRLNIKWTKS